MFKTFSRLDLQLLVRRIGWTWWFTAALLIAAASIELAATMNLRSALNAHKQELRWLTAVADAPSAVVSPDKPLNEQRLDAFVSTLGEKGEVNRLIGMLFAEARKHNITLAQAEYALEPNKAGGFYAYQITLPVMGSYPQLRRFVDGTLETTPCAALTDIDFKRDGIGARVTEAKLRFVFYLKDPPS